MRTDRNLNTKNSTFITHFKQLQANQRTQKSRNIQPETTRPCNKRFTTHCESMRNSEFFKSTNTNSQTLCNSEELRNFWEGCIRQFASIPRKDWKTRMLHWNTFSMWRLTIQKNSNFFESSLYASHLVGTESVVQSFVYQIAPILSRIGKNLCDSEQKWLASEGVGLTSKAGALRWTQWERKLHLK